MVIFAFIHNLFIMAFFLILLPYLEAQNSILRPLATYDMIDVSRRFMTAAVPNLRG